MADKQFDVPKNLQRLFEEKEKIRKAVRDNFLKNYTNPYRGAELQHDSAIIRHHAMLTYRSEHVRPNVRNVAGLMGFVVIPVITLYIMLNNADKEREAKYRSGTVAYKDRLWKHVM